MATRLGAQQGRQAFQAYLDQAGKGGGGFKNNRKYYLAVGGCFALVLIGWLLISARTVPWAEAFAEMGAALGKAQAHFDAKVTPVASGVISDLDEFGKKQQQEYTEEEISAAKERMQKILTDYISKPQE
ncbi:MAG: hypothetical protein V1821_03000 [bacterium]